MQIGHFHNSSNFVKSQNLKCQGYWRAGMERQRLKQENGCFLHQSPMSNLTKWGRHWSVVLPLLGIPSTLVHNKDVSG